MTHFVLWPEGAPAEALRFTSWWRMQIAFTRLHLINLLALSKARRLRLATCMEGFADPSIVEASLEERKAIPPRAGWPRPLPPTPQPDAPRGDVHVRTYSVV